MIIPCLLLFGLVSQSGCLDSDVAAFLPKPVIGAYFDEKAASMRQSFSLAVRTANRCTYDHEICEAMHPTAATSVNRHLFHQVEFSAVSVEAENDLASVRKNFGKLTGQDSEFAGLANDDGLSLVVGPHQCVTSLFVQGLCETHDIPHVVVRREIEREHSSFQTINLYPDTETLSSVFLEMIKALNWTTFSVIYESSDNFVALHKVLTMYPAYAYSVYGIRLAGHGSNYSEPLLRARQMQHKSFLIDCRLEILNDVLTQMQEVGMMTDDYKYVITTLDLHAIDWRQYRYSGVNIKGLQLLDTQNPFVRNFISEHLDDFGIETVEQLRLEDALMFDAVMMFSQAFKDLHYNLNYGKEVFRGAKFYNDDYQTPHPWKLGLSLRNYFLYTEVNGLTGPVAIDGDGARRRVRLDVVNLERTGLEKVGEWNFQNSFQNLKVEMSSEMPHYKVLITDNPPYATKVNHSRRMEGNARFEGLVIDIMEELAKELKFTYTFILHEDRKNGDCGEEKIGEFIVCTTCDGVMGRVMSGEVDMAIGDLTVTESRARCVQFSTAFMNLGISILAKKQGKEITLSSFLNPFDYQVWLYIMFSILFVSTLFFIVGRFCPTEWTNPYPCIEEPDHLENQFTISNSVWFTMGAILQQGSEIAPTGLSTRVLAGVWYFFCLIIVNTYIANLAASLTIEKPVKLINDIRDLYDQDQIKFGTLLNGSTIKYFEGANNENYKKLYNKMMSDDWKSYMVASNDDGVRFVNTTKYAFFMESSTIKYLIKRHCELEMIGDLINHKYYAIAYSKDFPAKNDVDKTITLLEEKSVMEELRKKWWDTRGAVCDDDDPNKPKPMTENELRGVFIVLFVGLFVFSTSATVYESSQDIRRIAKAKQLSFLQTVKLEMKAIMKSKPIKPALLKQRSTDTNLTDRSGTSITTTRA